MGRPGSIAIWVALALAITVPIGAAAMSPLLAWRMPVYIVAGFAGIVAMALLLIQPLLIKGSLPGLSPLRARRMHRAIGAAVILAVVIHVAGLWLTSPPDVVDALLFASPTPFSAWGVIAMWALFATGILALLRRRLRISPRLWRRMHGALAVVLVAGTVIHAVLIEGTMEPVSKAALSILIVLASARTLSDARIWAFGARKIRRDGP